MTAEDDRWTWSPDEIRRVGYRVVDLIAEHLTTLPSRPVFTPVPRDLSTAFLQEPAPRQGRDADAILEMFRATVEPYPFGNGHPRFFGWVNSPPTVMGIFADALAAAMNPSCAGGNHAAIYVERQVVQWFKELLGYPAEALWPAGQRRIHGGTDRADRRAPREVRIRRSHVRSPAEPISTRFLPDRGNTRVPPEGDRTARRRIQSHSNDSTRRGVPDAALGARGGHHA